MRDDPFTKHAEFMLAVKRREQLAEATTLFNR